MITTTAASSSATAAIRAASSVTFSWFCARQCQLLERAASAAEALREIKAGRVRGVERLAGNRVAIDTPLGRYIVEVPA